MGNGIRKMGFLSCVALVVGACIGSAVFSISGLTIFYAGPAAVVSWLAAALIYVGYGMVVTELAGRYPRSGGIYIFPKRAFGGRKGTLLGFVSAWGYLVSNIIAICFSAICIGVYLQAGFPSLSSGRVTSLIVLAVSLCILLVGGERSQSMQNVLVALLLGTMLIYCCTAFFGGGFNLSNFKGFFTSGSKGATGFISAIPLAMVAYGGCVVIAFLADEVDNAGKNVPRALFMGLGVVALIYAAIIVSIVGTLPQSELAGDARLRLIPLSASVSNGSLHAFPWLSKLIAVCVSIALLTTITALLRVNSRAMQVMSEENLLPEFLGRESSGGVPVPALISLALLCSVLCLPDGWTEQMISLGAVLNVISMAVTCFSLIAVRRKSVWLPLTVMLVFLLCYIPGILESGNDIWLFTLTVYVLGFIVFLVSRLTGGRRMRPGEGRKMKGVVVHGKGRGKLHGMPTANLKLEDCDELPAYGVWKTRIEVEGKVYRAATHVGLRPTDDDDPTPTVESLLVDFDGDLYGKEVTVIFDRYIRNTIRFNSLDELKRQIDQDINKIKWKSRK